MRGQGWRRRSWRREYGYFEWRWAVSCRGNENTWLKSDRPRRALVSNSVRLIPVGVSRPAMADGTLRRGPLMEARRTNATRIESVPHMPTLAHPAVLLGGGPPAERAADARTRRPGVLPASGFHIGIEDSGDVSRARHGDYYRSVPPMQRRRSR